MHYFDTVIISAVFGSLCYDFLRIRNNYLKSPKNYHFKTIKYKTVIFELFIVTITALSAGIVCYVLDITTKVTSFFIGYSIPGGYFFTKQRINSEISNLKNKRPSNKDYENETMLEELEEQDDFSKFSFFDYLKTAYFL